MNIRFCEFCSNVVQEALERCPVCGGLLSQEVSEEEFNDPANPWPFVYVDTLVLRIQGQPRVLRFDGTHSLYHFWSRLHREFDALRLCFRVRKEELELAGYDPENRPADFVPLDPGMLLNCRYRKFSFYADETVYPEIALEPGEMEHTYQGTLEIDDCPPELWGNVLGWLAGTAPHLAPGGDWTYDI